MSDNFRQCIFFFVNEWYLQTSRGPFGLVMGHVEVYIIILVGHWPVKTNFVYNGANVTDGRAYTEVQLYENIKNLRDLFYCNRCNVIGVTYCLKMKYLMGLSTFISVFRNVCCRWNVVSSLVSNGFVSSCLSNKERVKERNLCAVVMFQCNYYPSLTLQ